MYEKMLQVSTRLNQLLHVIKFIFARKVNLGEFHFVIPKSYRKFGQRVIKCATIPQQHHSSEFSPAATLLK